MARHIKQDDLLENDFHIDENNNIKSKTINNIAGTVKVTANEDNIEFTLNNNEYVKFDEISSNFKNNVINTSNKIVIKDDLIPLPNSTTDHKLQIDGYPLHKYGWKDNVVQITPELGDGSKWRDIGNGIFAMEFTQSDSVNVNYHVNHDYALNTNAYIHIHFICVEPQNAGSTITLQVDYVIAKGHAQGHSLTVTPTTFQMTYTYTGNEIAGEHIILECSDAQAFDLLEPDTLICLKLTLNSESVNGRFYILTLDLHYLSDREVTLNKVPDFNN